MPRNNYNVLRREPWPDVSGKFRRWLFLVMKDSFSPFFFFKKTSFKYVTTFLDNVYRNTHVRKLWTYTWKYAHAGGQSSADAKLFSLLPEAFAACSSSEQHNVKLACSLGCLFPGAKELRLPDPTLLRIAHRFTEKVKYRFQPHLHFC